MNQPLSSVLRSAVHHVFPRLISKPAPKEPVKGFVLKQLEGNKFIQALVNNFNRDEPTQAVKNVSSKGPVSKGVTFDLTRNTEHTYPAESLQSVTNYDSETNRATTPLSPGNVFKTTNMRTPGLDREWPAHSDPGAYGRAVKRLLPVGLKDAPAVDKNVTVPASVKTPGYTDDGKKIVLINGVEHVRIESPRNEPTGFLVIPLTEYNNGGNQQPNTGKHVKLDISDVLHLLKGRKDESEGKNNPWP